MPLPLSLDIHTFSKLHTLCMGESYQQLNSWVTSRAHQIYSAVTGTTGYDPNCIYKKIIDLVWFPVHFFFSGSQCTVMWVSNNRYW